MNFTREPIIETIISPREGYKLLVRSSKGDQQQEEHMVEALEVVSFGQALFFRSLERPKCFLFPVSDYEVLEVKETRVPLKNASLERSIKIGGGREAPMRREETPSEAEESAPMEQGGQQRSDRRRDRRRRRHRRPQDQYDGREEGREDRGSDEPSAQPSTEGGSEAREEASTPSVPSPIFVIPPPSTLISETIGKYKEKMILPPEEHHPKPRQEEGNGETTDLHRSSVSYESQSVITTFSSTDPRFFS